MDFVASCSTFFTTRTSRVGSLRDVCETTWVETRGYRRSSLRDRHSCRSDGTGPESTTTWMITEDKNRTLRKEDGAGAAEWVALRSFSFPQSSFPISRPAADRQPKEVFLLPCYSDPTAILLGSCSRVDLKHTHFPSRKHELCRAAKDLQEISRGSLPNPST
jgi:hypothetical protein